MGAQRFAEALKREIARNKWDKLTFRFIGDPAGNQMAQTNETTPFMILRAAGIKAYPANTNDTSIRIESVEGVLNRLVDGKPGMTVSPTCTNLISGFEGGYNYKRMMYMGSEKYDEKPNKNRFSHVHDALQYAMLGGGEGRRVIMGNQPAKTPTTVERASNPFQRLKRRNRMHNHDRMGTLR
jgi:hypothetical protein